MRISKSQLNIQNKATNHSLVLALKEFLISESQSEEKYQEIIESFPKINRTNLNKILYSITLDINKELFPPIENGEIVLTTRCNLACKYCFEKPMLVYSSDMDERVANKSVDFLFDYLGKSEKLNIVLFGGEPLLNSKALKKIVFRSEILSKKLGKKLSFSLTTNGTLLDSQWLDFFCDHNIKILLSIDGLKDSHNRNRIFVDGNGTFDLVQKNLEKLKLVQKYIGAKVTLTPNNLIAFSDDIKGLYGLGINHFIVSRASNLFWHQKDIELYIQELKNTYKWYSEVNSNSVYIDIFEEEKEKKQYFGCQAGKNSLTISTNGEISPCSRVLSYDCKRLIFKLGDIYKGITNIQNRKKLILCQELKENCSKRDFDDYKGGCFAINLEDEGDIFTPSSRDYFINLELKNVIMCMKKNNEIL